MKSAMFRSSRAFTIIELLLVIGIIGVLVAIGMALGGKVRLGGKTRLTEDAIRILDEAVVEYTSVKQGMPPPYVRDPVTSTPTVTWYIPIADAVNAGTSPPKLINSVGWFLYQASSTDSSDSVTSVDAILKGLSTKLLRSNLVFPTAGGVGGPGGTQGGDIGDGQLATKVPNQFRTVVDAFGKDLRYVHPAWDGVIDPIEETWQKVGDPMKGTRVYSVAKLRRSVTSKDADGGYCKNQRPYFYSAGPDGDPSTNDDNVYTARPDFRKD